MCHRWRLCPAGHPWPPGGGCCQGGKHRSPGPGLPSWGHRAPRGSGSSGLCLQEVSLFMPLLPFLLAEIFPSQGQSHSGTAGPRALLRSLDAALCSQEQYSWPDMKGKVLTAHFLQAAYPKWESSKIHISGPSFSSRPTDRLIVTGSDSAWGLWGTPSPCHAPLGWAGPHGPPAPIPRWRPGSRGWRLPPAAAGARVTELGRLRFQPPCYVSSADRGAGLRLYMPFSAASGWCCVILWLRVVCGTLSVWASAGSGRVKPRPRPVAWDGSGRQHPLTLGCAGAGSAR